MEHQITPFFFTTSGNAIYFFWAENNHNKQRYLVVAIEILRNITSTERQITERRLTHFFLVNSFSMVVRLFCK